ncbi:MAG: succinyldiaminopimelate transaminase [Porticoccaceae bacterium]|nr:succinyldiaminopimelate transaminase [Porticoccaceae bacterium]
MNANLGLLQAYPFQRLNELKAGIIPPAHLTHISLSIGEPRHPAPEFIKQALTESIDKLSHYPSTRGSIELRTSISQWLEQRFHLSQDSLDPESHVLPVCGTREAIFAFTQAAVSPNDGPAKPVVITPNPFYQIYEGSAILAGAESYLLDCNADNGFIPDLDAVPQAIWERCQLLQLCSPGNPTGAVMTIAQMQYAVHLADQYDFVIASDECYSDIYLDESKPPPGLLEACKAMGRHDYDRCVVFHSLSKRSNLPGLRSGFVAGDKAILSQFFDYRTYHGCSMSLPVQIASTAAWEDESHTIENRTLYREKFLAVTDILRGYMTFAEPQASFYLWAETPIDDQQFAKQLYSKQNVTLLPGQFLSRPTPNANPGLNRVRIALVAEIAECIEAAHRIKEFITSIDSARGT